MYKFNCRAAGLITPVFYTTKIQHKFSILIPLASCILLAFPHLTWFNINDVDSFHFLESKLNCCVNFSSSYNSAVKVINVISLALPLSILPISYLLIISATCKYQFSLRRQKDVRQRDEDFNFLSIRETQLSHYNLNIIKKSSLTVTTIFAIFVAPYFISDLISSCGVEVRFSLRRASVVLFFMSIGINPILYGYPHKNTRKCLRKIVQNCIPDPDFQGANIEEESDTRSIGGYPIPKITPINETSFHNHRFNPLSPGRVENYTTFGTYEKRLFDNQNQQADPNAVSVADVANSAQISSLPTECSLVTLMTSIEGDEEFLTATIHSPVLPKPLQRRENKMFGDDSIKHLQSLSLTADLNEKYLNEDSYDKYIDEDSF